MRYFLMPFLLFSAFCAALANVTVVKDAPEPAQVTLQNAQVKLVIDLAHGAHVVSYQYRGFENAEIVFDYKTENGALFKDLWTVEGWPGELDKRLYEAEIVSAGPDVAVVKTWTVSTGKYSNKTFADVGEIRIEKTFTLRKDDRTLTVDYAFTNIGAKGKRPAFWAQHAFDFDGKRKNNVYWRPTRHAVDWIHDEKRVSEYGYWFVAQVTAGWCGVTNKTLQRGVLFLMDYNDVQQVYQNTAANTNEWMYDDVAIPAGKTWHTSVKLIPTEGFAGYTYGDAHLVGYVTATETPAGLKLDHTLAAAGRALRNVTVKTSVAGVRTQWDAAAEPFTVETLGNTPLRRSLTVTGLGALPYLVRVNITGTDADGKPVTISYADYFGGSAGRNLDLVTLEPIYQFPIPEKQKQYLKPDTIALQRQTPPRILFVRGLWAEFQGIDEAVKQLGNVTVVDGWMKKSALGETLGNFPASYEDLLSYDVVILGNVSGPMLSTVGQEMLADFVKAGGGLLLLSGDRTYGQTTFSNANFANLLPYTSPGSGDYARLPKPQALALGDAHPANAGCAFPAKDIALYAHALAAKPGALVPVKTADGRPALITSGPNAPRVAVVAVLPFGKAADGQTLYWQGAAWQQAMANTLRWLLQK